VRAVHRGAIAPFIHFFLPPSTTKKRNLKEMSTKDRLWGSHFRGSFEVRRGVNGAI
jgi:hypothetical protein